MKLERPTQGESTEKTKESGGCSVPSHRFSYKVPDIIGRTLKTCWGKRTCCFDIEKHIHAHKKKKSWNCWSTTSFNWTTGEDTLACMNDIKSATPWFFQFPFSDRKLTNGKQWDGKLTENASVTTCSTLVQQICFIWQGNIMAKRKRKKYQKVAKLEFTQAEFMSQTVSPEYKVSSEKCLSGATDFWRWQEMCALLKDEPQSLMSYPCKVFASLPTSISFVPDFM